MGDLHVGNVVSGCKVRLGFAKDYVNKPRPFLFSSMIGQQNLRLGEKR